MVAFERRFWELKEVVVERPDLWPFKNVYKATCPHCDSVMLMPRSIKRKNRYGSMPCPFCWMPSRIPGTRHRTLLGRKITR